MAESSTQEKMQAAQNELLQNQERQKALLQQRQAEVSAMANMNQTLQQAAEVAVETAGGNQAQAQQFAQSTGAILGKYGMPIVQRSSSSTPQGGNVVINNTNNITVPPMQHQPIVVRNNEESSGGLQKFKAWLTGVFAKQSEEVSRRDREFSRQEGYLSRTSSKIMKRLEEFGSTVAETMNPKRIAAQMGSQLKTMLFLFGTYFLMANWGKILHGITEITKKLQGALDYFGITGDLAKQGKGFIADIKNLLGGKPGDSLKTIFSDIFRENVDIVTSFFKKEWEIRAMAAKQIKFPMDSLKGGMFNFIQNVGVYLGDLLSVLLTGPKGLSGSIGHSISNWGRQNSLGEGQAWANKDINHLTHFSRNTSLGDASIVSGGNTTISQDFSGDRLSNGTTASIRQGQAISAMIKDNSGKVNTSGVMSGLKRLKEAAGSKGVLVDPSFLESFVELGIPAEKLYAIASKGTPEYYKFVREEKGEADLADEGASFSRAFLERSIKNKAEDALGLGYIESVAAEAATNSFGSGHAGLNTYTAKSPLLSGVGAWINKQFSDTQTLRMVPESDPREGVTINGRNKWEFLRLTSDQLNELKSLLVGASGNAKFSFSTSDERSMESLDKMLRYAISRRTGKNISMMTTDYDSNIWENVREVERFKEEKDKEFDEKLKSTRTYQAADKMWTGTKEFISSGTRKLAPYWDSIMSGGKTLVGSNKILQKSSPEVKRRVAFCMKKLIDAGLSPGAAAGIVGNLLGEGLTTKRFDHEYPDGSGPSAGIAGFHSYYNGKKGELDNLKAYARSRNRYWGDLDVQVDYLIASGSYPSKVVNKIRVKTNGLDEKLAAEEAAYLWGHDYERFKGYNLGKDSKEYRKRISNALSVLENYSGIPIDFNATKEGIYEAELGGGGQVTKDESGNYVYTSSSSSSSTRTVSSSGSSTSSSSSSTSSTSSYTTSYTPSANPVAIQSFLSSSTSTNENLPDTGINISSSGSGNNTKKGFVALVGDSYAVGMASHFIKGLKSKDIEAKATCWPGGDKSTRSRYYCVSGATIGDITGQVKNAVGDSASVIVIHAGLNNYMQSEESIANQLMNCGKTAASGGAKVFLIAPIHGQTKPGLSEGAVKVARAVRTVCSAGGFGLIDLEPGSSKFTKYDKEGIHPADFATYANDVVALLMCGGGVVSLVKTEEKEGSGGVVGDGGFSPNFDQSKTVSSGGLNYRGWGGFIETSTPDGQYSTPRLLTKSEFEEAQARMGANDAGSTPFSLAFQGITATLNDIKALNYDSYAQMIAEMHGLRKTAEEGNNIAKETGKKLTKKEKDELLESMSSPDTSKVADTSEGEKRTLHERNRSMTENKWMGESDEWFRKRRFLGELGMSYEKFSSWTEKRKEAIKETALKLLEGGGLKEDGVERIKKLLSSRELTEDDYNDLEKTIGEFGGKEANIVLANLYSSGLSDAGLSYDQNYGFTMLPETNRAAIVGDKQWWENGIGSDNAGNTNGKNWRYLTIGDATSKSEEQSEEGQTRAKLKKLTEFFEKIKKDLGYIRSYTWGNVDGQLDYSKTTKLSTSTKTALDFWPVETGKNSVTVSLLGEDLSNYFSVEAGKEINKKNSGVTMRTSSFGTSTTFYEKEANAETINRMYSNYNQYLLREKQLAGEKRKFYSDKQLVADRLFNSNYKSYTGYQTTSHQDRKNSKSWGSGMLGDRTVSLSKFTKSLSESFKNDTNSDFSKSISELSNWDWGRSILSGANVSETIASINRSFNRLKFFQVASSNPKYRKEWDALLKLSLILVKMTRSLTENVFGSNNPEDIINYFTKKDEKGNSYLDVEGLKNLFGSTNTGLIDDFSKFYELSSKGLLTLDESKEYEKLKNKLGQSISESEINENTDIKNLWDNTDSNGLSGEEALAFNKNFEKNIVKTGGSNYYRVINNKTGRYTYINENEAKKYGKDLKTTGVFLVDETEGFKNIKDINSMVLMNLREQTENSKPYKDPKTGKLVRKVHTYKVVGEERKPAFIVEIPEEDWQNFVNSGKDIAMDYKTASNIRVSKLGRWRQGEKHYINGKEISNDEELKNYLKDSGGYLALGGRGNKTSTFGYVDLEGPNNKFNADTGLWTVVGPGGQTFELTEYDHRRLVEEGGLMQQADIAMWDKNVSLYKQHGYDKKGAGSGRERFTSQKREGETVDWGEAFNNQTDSIDLGNALAADTNSWLQNNNKIAFTTAYNTAQMLKVFEKIGNILGDEELIKLATQRMEADSSTLDIQTTADTSQVKEETDNTGNTGKWKTLPFRLLR